MVLAPALSSPPPVVVVHLAAAVGALVLGPLAMWLRKGSRPHRAAGYAWVTLMAAAALSSVFIRDFRMPNLSGYTALHGLTLATLVGIGLGVWHVSHGRVARHRRAMQMTYAGLVLAGVFAFLPQRYLGGLVREQWLSLRFIDPPRGALILRAGARSRLDHVGGSEPVARSGRVRR